MITDRMLPMAVVRLTTEDRAEHPEASGSAKGSTVKGYVVVFEGDDEPG
jgi:hypothetical protein